MSNDEFTLATDLLPGADLDEFTGNEVILDSDINDLKLNGRTLHAEIHNAITGGTIDRTIEGASTVVLNIIDRERELLSKKDLVTKVTWCSIDDLEFALVAFEKNDDIINLTFEDRIVFWMRLSKYAKARKAFRNKVTRAEFARALVREIKEAKIRFFCPELHERQLIATSERRTRRTRTHHQRRHRDHDHQAGFHSDEVITSKGNPATRKQRQVITDVLEVGHHRGYKPKFLITALATTTDETDNGNDPRTYQHGRGVFGVFQQNPSFGWPASGDTKRDARAFYDHLEVAYKKNPSHSAGELAHDVQGNRDPNVYKRWVREATKTVNLYLENPTSLPLSVSNTKSAKAKRKRFQFFRSAGETTWDCLGRLAEEVGWRRFVVGKTLYFISDEQLFKGRPRIAISEDSEGVDSINWSVDIGKKISEVTVTARMKQWAAPPGTIVKITKPKEVEGKWLVHSINRDLFLPTATIVLNKPVKELPEPKTSTSEYALGGGALQITDGTVTTRGGVSGIPSGNDAVSKAYAKAKAIHRKHYPYVYGGGHGRTFGPTGGGLDCSGAVSWVLAAGGMLDAPPQATPGLVHWGKAGTGKHMTVWVKPFGSQAHTFIVFHLPGHSREHFGTGHWGKSWGGAGFNSRLHPTSGFTPRHWPGT